MGRHHELDIVAMDRHPQGRLLATAGGRRVLLWDLPSQAPVRALPAVAGEIKFVRFVKGGEEIVGLSCPGFADCELLRWQTQGGGVLDRRPVPLRGQPTEALSSDGSLLVYTEGWGTRQGVLFLDTGSGAVRRRVARSGATPAALAAGRACAALGLPDGAIEVYQADTDAPLRLDGSGTQVRALAADPGCALVASVGQDGSIRRWRPGREKEAAVLGTVKRALSPRLVLDTRGERLAYLGDREITLFGPGASSPAQSLKAPYAKSALFLGADSLAVDNDGTLEIYDLRSGQAQVQPRGGLYRRAYAHSWLSFSGDGKVLLGAGLHGLRDGHVLAWSAEGVREVRAPLSGEQVFFPTQKGLGSLFLPELQVEQYTSSPIERPFADAPTARPIRGLPEALDRSQIGPLLSGRRVLLDVDDHYLLVDTKARKMLRPAPFTRGKVEAIATHGQGSLIARQVPVKDVDWASPRFDVQVWETQPWRQIARVTVAGERPSGIWFTPLDMAFSPSGRVLAVHSGGRLGLFAARSGQALAAEVQLGDRLRAGPAFSPDEKVAVVTTSRALVGIEVATGAVLFRSPVEGVRTATIAVHPRLPLVAVGAADGELTLHSLKDGQRLLSLHAFSTDSDTSDDLTQAWVALAPDGRVETSPEGTRFVIASRGLQPVPTQDLGTQFTAGLLSEAFQGRRRADSPAEMRVRFLISPPAEVRTALVQLTFAAENPAGKVRTLELAVDERTAWSEVRDPGGPSTLTRTAAVALRPGPNRLRLIARDAHGLPSPAAEVTVRYAPPPSGHVELLPQIGHQEWVYSIAFAPNGALLATGSPDQTVRLWEAKSGLLLPALRARPA